MALKNIWQRKTRSLLTILGIAVSVTLYLYMTIIMNWYDQDLQRQLSGMAGKVVVAAKNDSEQGFPPSSSVITQSDAEAVLNQSGVDKSRSTPILFQALVANPAPNMPPAVQAVGLIQGREEAFRGDVKVEGTAALSGADDVILGAKAAEHYGKKVGDSLVIQDHTFHVAGVIEKSYELLNSAVIMPLQTAQTVFARPGVATLVYITAAQADQTQPIADAITSSNPKLQTMTSDGMARSAEKALSAQRAFFTGVKGTTIAVSLIVITIVMVMAVGERKKEIGTMKALGAKARSILGLVISEAVVLSLVGGLVAIPFSWARFLGSEQRLDLGLAVQTAVLAALIGAAASLWPALSALRVDPLESLRHE